MSQELDCLHNIIGLSQTTCECFEDGKPLDYNESLSGLYLDQTEGLEINVIDSIKDCAQGGVWDIMSRARDNAILGFKADVLGLLLTKYKQKRQPFSGVIGSAKFKSNLNLNYTFAGQRLYMNNIIGGVLKIKRIGLLFGGNYSFDIEFRNELDESPFAVYTVESENGKLKWNNIEDLELPMNLETDDNPNYYITYSVNGMLPKDSNNGCGCGSSVYKYYWNTQRPSFKTYQKDRWSEFVMITGIVGNDLNDRENWGTTQYNNGIFLDVEFKCSVSDLVCGESMDFENNPIAIAMAWAVRYKAAFYLLDSILASPEINRFTMMDRERLMQKKNTYNQLYQERIEWISGEINYQSNDCLTCDDFNDIVKVGILA